MLAINTIDIVERVREVFETATELRIWAIYIRTFENESSEIDNVDRV